MSSDDIAPAEIPAPPPVLHPGDIVQVIDQEDRWFPALVVVDEVKAWGVQGFAFMPRNDGPPVPQVSYRLQHGKFERVGRAVVMSAEMAKARDASLATADLVARDGATSPAEIYVRGRRVAVTARHLEIARRLYAARPFVMASSETTQGAAIGKAFEFDGAPAYYQTDMLELADAVISGREQPGEGF